MSFRIDYHKRHLFTITSEFYTTLDRKLISINSQKMSTLKRIIIKDFEWILLREIFILELLTIEFYVEWKITLEHFQKKNYIKDFTLDPLKRYPIPERSHYRIFTTALDRRSLPWIFFKRYLERFIYEKRFFPRNGASSLVHITPD